MDGLFVLEGGPESNPGNRIQYPFRSDHFIILLQLAGEGRSRINFVDYETQKGRLLIIPPNAIRQFFELPDDCRFAALIFTAEFLSQSGLNQKYSNWLDLFSTTRSHCIEAAHNDFGMLLSLLRVLRQKYASRNGMPQDQQVIHQLFQAFLYEFCSIYQRCNQLSQTQYSRKEDISMRFMRLATQSFREERGVLFYAERLHMTPRYLTQTVKETTGRSAGEIIDDMVIREAKVLLSDMSLTVAQVAEMLYFSDQFFFSKFFKRLAGVAPSEYRRLA